MAETDRAAKVSLEALSSAREATARAEERMEGAKRRLADVEREIHDMLEVEPQAVAGLAEIEPGAELPPLAEIEENLEKLRRDRERLGAVNLRAEEELREVEAQHTALTTERDDLVEAIKRLRQGIQSLNREARERLLASFEIVNAHFKRLFTELFGGGEAALHLIESDDPLEAGLEIIAKPPGKKPQTLSLLSGGEQALTALALIFAVFLTNPSPICVLDEVDAPLDDHNVERFCNLLHEMTQLDRHALHHHHAQPDHHGADEPAVRRHHGRARRLAAGLGRARRGREDPRPARGVMLCRWSLPAGEGGVDEPRANRRRPTPAPRGERPTLSKSSASLRPKHARPQGEREAEHAMIPPDLPAELKAALDAKLEGLSRNDVAARAAAISKTYRDGGSSARSNPKPTRSPMRWRGCPRPMPPSAPASTRSLEAGPTSRRQPCSMSAPDRARRAGRRPKPFRRCTSFTLLDANPALRTLALDLLRRQARFGGLNYDAGDARAALAKAEAADLVIASYLIGELGEAERRRSRTRCGRRRATRSSSSSPARPRAMRASSRCARATDRRRRACRWRPARMTKPARCSRRTGAISPSASPARARTSRSRAPRCRSRTSSSPMSC